MLFLFCLGNLALVGDTECEGELQGLLDQEPWTCVSQWHHHASWSQGFKAVPQPGSLPTKPVWRLIQQNCQPSQGVWAIDP